MLLYEASNVEEPCAGKPHAGICERAVGKPACSISIQKKTMNELIRKLVRQIQLIWFILAISMVAYIPIVFFVVKKERLKGSAPGHLEGMWPIFLIASLVLGIMSIFQYKKYTNFKRLQDQIKRKSCPIEEYFKDKKTGEITKSVEEELNKLDKNEIRLLHLPYLYLKPVVIGLCLNTLIAVSGVCLSLSTHSYFLDIPFVSLGLFFSLFMFPEQKQIVSIANKIKKC
ncbi:MAG: hypothetical protein ACMUJM_20680 [bacterium]